MGTTANGKLKTVLRAGGKYRSSCFCRVLLTEYTGTITFERDPKKLKQCMTSRKMWYCIQETESRNPQDYEEDIEYKNYEKTLHVFFVLCYS